MVGAPVQARPPCCLPLTYLLPPPVPLEVEGADQSFGTSERVGR